MTRRVEAVYLRESSNKYSQKHNNDAPEFCYFFRSHNAMGGYGDTGEALLDEKGSLQILDVNDHGRSAVYIAMMTCTPNRRLGDIATEVKKRAQQYADCLKAAVNNPSIICKQ